MATVAGWNWLTNAAKRHYFGLDGRSLCGKWMILASNRDSDQNDDHADNCRGCRKRRDTRVGAGKGEEGKG